MAPAIKRSASASPTPDPAHSDDSASQFDPSTNATPPPSPSPRKKQKPTPSPRSKKGGGGGGGMSSANRLTGEQKSKLMEMAMDKFSEHADYGSMSAETGLPVDTIKAQFKKVKWSNLRQAAITKAGQ